MAIKPIPPALLVEARRRIAYDANTGQFHWLVPPNNAAVGGRAGSLTPRGYRRICINGHLLAEHRLAWAFAHGSLEPTDFVDHINCDRSDNRICNLRLATASDNNVNSLSIRGRSKFRGVSMHTATGKWQACIKQHGKTTHLGYFASEEEAALSYDAAAVRMFGEFARINLGSQLRRQALADLHPRHFQLHSSVAQPSYGHRRPNHWVSRTK
jgi:hypothetical protein